MLEHRDLKLRPVRAVLLHGLLVNRLLHVVNVARVTPSLDTLHRVADALGLELIVNFRQPAAT